MNNESEQLTLEQKLRLENAMAENSDPLSVEEVKEYLQRNENGKIKMSRQNCVFILKNNRNLKGVFRKNLLSNMIDITKPLGWRRSGTHITETDLNYLYLYFEENYEITNEKNILGALDTVSNDFSYHPICDYLDSLVWDGKERIRYALNKYMGAATDDYTYESLLLFMIGAISRIYNPGCKFDIMFCLVGGQGAGKSSFFRLLAIKDEWFSDDIKKLEDENIRRKIQGHWIIEMSEMLAMANAKTIGDIKSFLSRMVDTYKVPYAKYPEDYPRQCVFAGTSNDMDFLPLDRSGNRRFIPILVQPELAIKHLLDDEEESRAYILQMWAEAMTIYKRGPVKLTFSKEMETYLKEYQKAFMPEDTEAGMIVEYLESCTENAVCSKLLYEKALRKDLAFAKKYEFREICEIMNTMKGWQHFENPRSFGIYGRQKGWERVVADEATDSFVPISEMKQIKLPFD